MKINISLNPKSIENAIKQFQKAQTQLETVMLKEFLLTCCTWIYDDANKNLMYSSIGENVKANIMTGWQEPTIRQEGKRMIATLKNTDDQAVYVEFGVGIVGQENAHERVKDGQVNYQYNIGTKINKETNQWIFNVSSDNDIDNQAEYIDKKTTNTVKTKGSPAVMYAYNACVNLDTIGFKAIWEQIKKRYWG